MADTGNFHVFFPHGCYRDKRTPKRNEIIAAIDEYIQANTFDLEKFNQVKSEYLKATDEQEHASFGKLNEIVLPVFEALLKQGFAIEDLQNNEGNI